jgi:hypothetical protein
LVTDFGVDPHEDLQQLHGRILRRDPTLLAERRVSLDGSVVTLEDDLIEMQQEARGASVTIS